VRAREMKKPRDRKINKNMRKGKDEERDEPGEDEAKERKGGHEGILSIQGKTGYGFLLNYKIRHPPVDRGHYFMHNRRSLLCFLEVVGSSSFGSRKVCDVMIRNSQFAFVEPEPKGVLVQSEATAPSLFWALVALFPRIERWIIALLRPWLTVEQFTLEPELAKKGYRLGCRRADTSGWSPSRWWEPTPTLLSGQLNSPSVNIALPHGLHRVFAVNGSFEEIPLCPLREFGLNMGDDRVRHLGAPLLFGAS